MGEEMEKEDAGEEMTINARVADRGLLTMITE